MSCLIRKEPVVWTPEEKVRQALLHFMITVAGYPTALIGVELSLSNLPHLASRKQKLPKRRADILVFSSSTMKPLLLIECKAGALSSSAMDQAIGYNLIVEAPYLVLAGPNEIKTGTYTPDGWVFSSGFPHYPNIRDLRL